MLTLQVPDRCIVVVECKPKDATGWSLTTSYRDCLVPPMDNIQAEFSGDKAKLKWPVSIDGKKLQSETSKIKVIR